MSDMLPTPAVPVDEEHRRRRQVREDRVLGLTTVRRDAPINNEERRARRDNERTDDFVYAGSGQLEYMVPQETMIASGAKSKSTKEGYVYRSYRRLEIDPNQNQMPPPPTDEEVESLERAIQEKFVQPAMAKAAKQQQQKPTSGERLREFEAIYGTDDRMIRKFKRSTPLAEIPRRVLIDPFSVFIQPRVIRYIYNHPYVEKLELAMRPIRNESWRVLFDRKRPDLSLGITETLYSLQDITTTVEWSGCKFYDAEVKNDHYRLLTFRFLDIKPKDDDLVHTTQYLTTDDLASAKKVEQFVESYLHFHIILIQRMPLPTAAASFSKQTTTAEATLTPEEEAKQRRRADPVNSARVFFVFASFYSMLSQE
jgi:hypothetical protein